MLRVVSKNKHPFFIHFFTGNLRDVLVRRGWKRLATGSKSGFFVEQFSYFRFLELLALDLSSGLFHSACFLQPCES